MGTLSAWGDGRSRAPAARARRGSGSARPRSRGPRPATAWPSWSALLALVTGTLAKIGNEVYNLQRPEIGELSEAPTEGVVGSITMPQKRNPERSEHLSTLASVVRAAAGQALEAMVAEHERDGAAWKIEWAMLPQACGAAAVALALGAELAAGLRVDEQRMRENVDAQRGYVLAEPAMLALGAEIGPRRAHELVQAATVTACRRRRCARRWPPTPRSPRCSRRSGSRRCCGPELALGSAAELVRRVLGDD